MDSGRNKTAGFTLVELLVTLSIVAILTVIAIPSFGGLADQVRLSGAVRTLASDLRMARQLAMAKGISVRVVMDATNHRYHLGLADDAGSVFGGHDFRDATQGFGGVRIAGFSNSSCDGIVTFSRRGTTSCATTITLATKTASRALTVIMTGRVRVTS